MLKVYGIYIIISIDPPTLKEYVLYTRFNVDKLWMALKPV